MQLRSSISGSPSARSILKAQGSFDGCQGKSQNDCAESSQKMVVVGKFGKTFGVEGFIKVHSFTEIPENILKFFPWYISVDERSWVALAHDNKAREQNSYNAVIKGKNILIKPPAINSPEEAQVYTNQLIGITREQMPPLEDGDFYWTDLEKLRVVTKDGKELGIIDHIFNSGASDILVVKDQKHAKPIYIPYLKHVVLNVDLKGQKLIVDWDE